MTLTIKSPLPSPSSRSAELVALIAVSCTLFLFLHTQSLTSRLREMEVKLQPSEMSASGLSGNSISQGEEEARRGAFSSYATTQGNVTLHQRRWLMHFCRHIAVAHVTCQRVKTTINSLSPALPFPEAKYNSHENNLQNTFKYLKSTGQVSFHFFVHLHRRAFFSRTI